MGAKDKLIAKLWDLLKKLIVKYGAFIMLPAVFLALIKLANGILDKLLDQLKKDAKNQNGKEDELMNKIAVDPLNPTDDEYRKYVASSPELRSILFYADNTLNEDRADAIVKACTNPNYSAQQTAALIAKLNTTDGAKSASSSSANSSSASSLSGNDFLKFAQEESDFDTQTEGFNTEKDLPKINDWSKNLRNSLPWIFLIIAIIIGMKEWLNQNERPSKYRTKAFSKRIRLIGALLKSSPNSTGNSTSGLITIVKSLDAVLGAISIAVLIYEANRKTLQEESLKELNLTCKSMLCPPTTVTPAFTINPDAGNNNTNNNAGNIQQGAGSTSPVNIPTSLDNFSCPIPTDNFIVPKEPFENAANSFSCPVPIPTFQTSPELSASAPPLSDTATKAIYKYYGSETLTWIVKPKQSVTEKSILFLKGSGKNQQKIYSDVIGKVLSIDKTKKELVIENIKDPTLDDLDKDIKSFSDAMLEQTETDLFIKDWYIRTLLPPMLKVAVRDPSASGILYPIGGIESKYQNVLDEGENAKDRYEQKAQDQLSGNKVQEAAENGKTDTIKKTLDNLNAAYYQEIKGIANNYLYKASKTLTTIPVGTEYVLIDWYLELYNDLINYSDNTQSLEYKVNTPPKDKVENKTLQSFITGISTIITKRVFVEGTSQSVLIDRVNAIGSELDKSLSLTGGYISYRPNNYYSLLQNKWDYQLKGGRSEKTLKKAQESISSFISSLGKGNNSITSEAKNSLKYRMFLVFKLAQEVRYKRDTGFSTSTSKVDLTSSEANYINNFFDILWKKRVDTPKKIAGIMTKLNDYDRNIIPPSIIKIGEEEFRLYGFGDKRTCPISKVGDYQSPFSAYEFKDIQYWIKYCAFATLASVIGFPLTWSTGLPPPIGPIPFPTVYIPLKAFQLKWGILLLGLTITGIYPFPFVMVANLSTDHHIPLGDPATALNAAIDVAKKGILASVVAMKSNVVKPEMKKEEKKVSEDQSQIEEIELKEAEHRRNKPKKDRTLTKDEMNAKYDREIADWNAEGDKLASDKLAIKNKQMESSKKWTVLKGVEEGGEVTDDLGDPKLKSIAVTEKGIAKSFDALNASVAAIDPFVAAIPLSTAPGSANFFPTAKNPKPITEFGNDLNESVNESVLESTTKPLEIENNDLMNTKFKDKLNNTYVKGTKYRDALQVASLALISKDPFPKYENLKATNLQWTVGFLLPKWALKGAGQYGWPGFPQYPV